MSVLLVSWLPGRFSRSCVRDFFSPLYCFRTAFCGWQGPVGVVRCRLPVHDRRIWIGYSGPAVVGTGEDPQRLLISDRPAVLIDQRDDEAIRACPSVAAGPLPFFADHR